MWQQLSPLIAQSTDRLTAWQTLLEHQLRYAAVHGRRRKADPPVPMKPSAARSLLAATVGVIKRYRPEMLQVPPSWGAEMDRLLAVLRRDGVTRAVPATMAQIVLVASTLRQKVFT